MTKNKRTLLGVLFVAGFIVGIVALFHTNGNSMIPIHPFVGAFLFWGIGHLIVNFRVL